MSVRSDAEAVARQLRSESRYVAAEAVEAAVALLDDDPDMDLCEAPDCPFEAVVVTEGASVCRIHLQLSRYHPWHRMVLGMPVTVPDEVEDTPLTIPAKFTPVPGDRPATC
jgi:hypothetical protein